MSALEEVLAKTDEYTGGLLDLYKNVIPEVRRDALRERVKAIHEIKAKAIAHPKESGRLYYAGELEAELAAFRLALEEERLVAMGSETAFMGAIKASLRTFAVIGAEIVSRAAASAAEGLAKGALDSLGDD